MVVGRGYGENDTHGVILSLPTVTIITRVMAGQIGINIHDYKLGK